MPPARSWVYIYQLAICNHVPHAADTYNAVHITRAEDRSSHRTARGKGLSIEERLDATPHILYMAQARCAGHASARRLGCMRRLSSSHPPRAGFLLLGIICCWRCRQSQMPRGEGSDKLQKMRGSGGVLVRRSFRRPMKACRHLKNFARAAAWSHFFFQAPSPPCFQP